MGSTHSATWKSFERVIALAWTAATGINCARNILSGANNRSDTGKPRPGDVVISPDFNGDVIIEAKLRAKFAHHALFVAAKADAKKHGIRETLLYTKQKSQVGYLVTMEADLFHKMLAIPEVQRLLQRDESKPRTIVRTKRTTKSSKGTAHLD